jgi:hypothetical protein
MMCVSTVCILLCIYYILFIHCQYVSCVNRIDGVIVSLLASSAVYRGFEPRSG